MKRQQKPKVKTIPDVQKKTKRQIENEAKFAKLEQELIEIKKESIKYEKKAERAIWEVTKYLLAKSRFYTPINN